MTMALMRPDVLCGLVGASGFCLLGRFRLGGRRPSHRPAWRSVGFVRRALCAGLLRLVVRLRFRRAWARHQDRRCWRSRRRGRPTSEACLRACRPAAGRQGRARRRTCRRAICMACGLVSRIGVICVCRALDLRKKAGRGEIEVLDAGRQHVLLVDTAAVEPEPGHVFRHGRASAAAELHAPRSGDVADGLAGDRSRHPTPSAA